MQNQTLTGTAGLCNVFRVFHNETDSVVQSVTVISTTFSVFIFISNVLLFLALLRTKQTKSPTILFVYVSIVDSLVGALMAVTMPYAARTIYDDGFDRSCVVTAVLTFLTAFVTTLSHSITILLAVDRYNHMNPNRAASTCLAKIFTKPYKFFVATAVILFCMQYPITYFIGAYYQIPLDTYQLSVAVIYMGVTLFVSMLYLQGYLRVIRFVDESPIYQNNDGIVARPQYVRRLFKTVLLLMSVAIITHVPSTIGNMLISIHRLLDIKGNIVSRVFYHLTIPSVLIGPCINPIIVFRYNNDAMSWLKSCFCGCTVAGRQNQVNV